MASITLWPSVNMFFNQPKLPSPIKKSLLETEFCFICVFLNYSASAAAVDDGDDQFLDFSPLIFYWIHFYLLSLLFSAFCQPPPTHTLWWIKLCRFINLCKFFFSFIKVPFFCGFGRKIYYLKAQFRWSCWLREAQENSGRWISLTLFFHLPFILCERNCF